MSWEAATVLALVTVLALAAVWYELSRPSSKQIALIATLAALAVVGRLVFAAIPNVQATTDIVFFSGYVFGGLPGAAVGVVAALVSNFFLGQGPWTPWQMLGWGFTGVLGATIAKVGRHEPSRLSLALACAFAGLVFGAIMNFSTWITFAGTHTLRSFLAVAAAAFWFDMAHATGNLLLALAAGPMLVRTLRRYRRRFEVNWGATTPTGAGRRAWMSGATLLLLPVLPILPAPHVADAGASSISRGVSYLRAAQNGDGGFGSAKGEASAQMYTGWAVLGLEAAGEDPTKIKKGGKSVIDYIRQNARSIDDLGEIERTVLALGGAGISPRHFAGRDLYRELARRQERDGSFGGQVNFTAFGIMALRAAGKSARSASVKRAATWIARQQGRDGGFSSVAKGVSGVDMTAAALEALAAASSSSKSADRAVKYLNKARNADGGYGQFPKGESNGQSTAWAVQGLVAAGRSPRRSLEFLRSLQQPNGSFRYSRTSAQTPVWVTAQVLPALAKKPFPLRPAL